MAGVIGFCFCIRRSLLDEIGPLDERFVNGYEETDYCYRAVQAGYDVLVARDVFVHHAGSQTFREQGALPEERDSRYWTLIEENWQRFKEKWDIPEEMSANEGLGWLLRQVAPTSTRPRIFWAVLFERALLFEPADRFLDIADTCARAGCERIVVPYTATDNARNHIERKFLAQSHHPDDVLVMLDADHMHPKDIVLHLAGYPHEIGVVGALAFRRAAPHDPQFYVQDETGALQQPADIDELTGCLAEGDLVGSGAIAIKRWVFDRLSENGYHWPHWRVQYPENTLNRPGEEIHFAECCQKIGVRHYCAIDAETPHVATMLVSRRTWETYRQKHPEIVRDLEEVKL